MKYNSALLCILLFSSSTIVPGDNKPKNNVLIHTGIVAGIVATGLIFAHYLTKPTPRGKDTFSEKFLTLREQGIEGKTDIEEVKKFLDTYDSQDLGNRLVRPNWYGVSSVPRPILSWVCNGAYSDYDLQLVQYLLHRNIAIGDALQQTCSTEDQMEPFETAPKILKMLIASKADVNHRNEFGETALFYCASDQTNVPNAQILIAANANPNISTKKSLTPLTMASCQVWFAPECFELFLIAGAQPNVNIDTPKNRELLFTNPGRKVATMLAQTYPELVANLPTEQRRAYALMMQQRIYTKLLEGNPDQEQDLSADISRWQCLSGKEYLESSANTALRPATAQLLGEHLLPPLSNLVYGYSLPHPDSLITSILPHDLSH